MDERVIIRSRAPLRISFAGGGSDVSPFADEKGGAILNATISRHAYVTLELGGDDIRITSRDYGRTRRIPLNEVDDVPLERDLVLGVIHRLGAHRHGTGFHVYSRVDCPPGSGLGASSTLVVALIGAFDRWLNIGLDGYEIAHLAVEIERKDLDIAGGRQDQYAAAFGGFNFMEFKGDTCLVNPLRIREETICELEASVILAYTGGSRLSDRIISTQIANYRDGHADSIQAMDRTKELASLMKHALLTHHFEEFGELLHEAWLAKRQMSADISTPKIDHLYEVARENGAIGGKISGAGGGGFMYFFCDFDRRQSVGNSIKENGATLVDFSFTNQGLQTWER